MKKRRWTCIDILKCLAAIAVVEIQKPLEIQGGDEFLILCRFAVPVFFMITGFFYPETVAKKRATEAVWKVFTITILANPFYLLWEILLAVEKRENIKKHCLQGLRKQFAVGISFCGIFPRFHRTCGICRHFSMCL